MIKRFLQEGGEYKRDTILTPIFTAAEVVMEVLIPYVTAMIIDQGINAGDMNAVLQICTGIYRSFPSPISISFRLPVW